MTIKLKASKLQMVILQWIEKLDESCFRRVFPTVVMKQNGYATQCLWQDKKKLSAAAAMLTAAVR
jgi:hypothetical protein